MHDKTQNCKVQTPILAVGLACFSLSGADFEIFVRLTSIMAASVD